MKKSLSAEKRDRQNKRRRTRNRAMKSIMKTRMKKASSTKAPADVSAAYSVLDRAVKSNLLHRKSVARMKSRLARAAKPQKQG